MQASGVLSNTLDTGCLYFGGEFRFWTAKRYKPVLIFFIMFKLNIFDLCGFRYVVVQLKFDRSKFRKHYFLVAYCWFLEVVSKEFNDPVCQIVVRGGLIWHAEVTWPFPYTETVKKLFGTF